MTQEYVIEVEPWFLEEHPFLEATKRKDGFYFPIRSKTEAKFYANFKDQDVFVNIQKLIKSQDFKDIVYCVLLHECGGITHIQITQDAIKGQEPAAWVNVDHVEHDYCYDCSKCEKES